MQWFSSNRRFGPALPACFAISLLACSINTTFAADDTTATTATDLGTVGASYDGGAAAPASAAPTASKTAPVQSSLAARSAQAVVSDNFLRNYIAPTADFSQAVQMTPGLFSYSPNGVGLGDTRTNFRGFTDGNYNMTFDGIPFQDTNGVSHHSWVFFPGPFLGGTVVDRSPGSASSIGVATFNGSINLLSRNLDPQESSSVSGSLGSWNTHTLGFEHETGQFGEDGNQNLLFTAQNMSSDGYQTYNDQNRKDFSLKYQNALTNNTVLTVFASALNMQNNTPNVTTPTRGQIAQYGNNYLLSNDPTKANYWRYNFYNVDTYFDYVGITSNLGNGWKLDDKVYAYRYGNNQNYDNSAPISASSASAKLNEYETKGNILRLSKESSMGTLRTGLWLDYADSNRYTTNADPRTWVNFGLPQNQESYTTTTVQPFVEYEFNVTDKLKITPGLKYAFYQQDFTHMPDTGSPGVGNLGGAASVSNTVSYHDVLPSFDVHYMLQPNWSLYGQYGTGDIIPPTSVFDVKNAYVATQPKPQYARTTQFGTVWQSDKYTFDFDVYHTSLQGSYSSYLDANLNPVYYLSGTEISQGVEAESNILLGRGFSLYLNGTYGSVKYANTGLWFAGAPSDTETVGLSYQQDAWNVGAFAKRVGQSYSDNGSTHQAFTIDPVTLTNLFANYTMKLSHSFAKQARIQFGINNLFNQEKITSVVKAGSSTSSSANPSMNDLVQITPGRSVSTTLTLDF